MKRWDANSRHENRFLWNITRLLNECSLRLSATMTGCSVVSQNPLPSPSRSAPPSTDRRYATFMPGKSAVAPSATGGVKKLYSQVNVAQSRLEEHTAGLQSH